MMKQKLFFIIVFMNITNAVYGQSSLIKDSFQLDENYFREDIYSIQNLDSCNFNVEIINNTTDTVYLFDSYLLDNLSKSEYLHRYNKEQKICKLSFLPLIPFLSVTLSDVVVLGKEKIIKRYQTLYSFKTIYPKSGLRLKIPIKSIETTYHIQDFNTKNKDNFDELIFTTLKNKTCLTKSLEFAIFKHIDLLTTRDPYFINPKLFNNQAKSYLVINVPY